MGVRSSQDADLAWDGGGQGTVTKNRGVCDAGLTVVVYLYTESGLGENESAWSSAD